MTVTSPALVVASADGRAVASVRGGRALVFDAASLAVTADGAVAADAIAAGLLATRLAVLTPRALEVHELPELATRVRAEVPPAATWAGGLGERVVLVADGVVLLARAGSHGVHLEPLARADAVEDAVPLDDDRLLLIAAGAAVIVSAQSQRTLAKLHARLPPAPRMCGAAAGRRMLWAARPGDRDLLLVRLSDGRTFTYRPAAPIDAVYAHPASPWLVVATAAGLERVHALTLAGRPMAAELERGACVAGADESVLCWIDRQGRPRRTPLDGDAVIGGAGLRLAMGAERRVGRLVADVADDGQARPRVGRPGGSASASALWRVELADWARAALAGPDAAAAAPTLDDTPLGELARRAALDPRGAQALALLYGAWLVGGRRPALATLARLAAWDELGGAGSLPAAGLTLVARGRVALRTAVARFLDGGAPARVTLVGGAATAATAATAAARGRIRVHTDPDLPLAAAARAVADQLGGAAITDDARAGGRRGLAIALDEAWLRQRPLIAVPSGGLDLEALAAAPLRPDHALVVVWPDALVPDALASWIALTSARSTAG